MTRERLVCEIKYGEMVLEIRMHGDNYEHNKMR